METQSARLLEKQIVPTGVPELALRELAGSYWNKYYSEAVEIQERTAPSDFCRYCVDSVFRSDSRNVVDLGCGNGRDSVFLAQSGFRVTAVDQSGAALQLLKSHSKRQNVSVHIFRGNFARFHSPVPTNAYSRFSLHAIDAESQITLFQNVRWMVYSDHVFAIEARTTEDVNPVATGHEERWDGDHYRRYLHVPTLVREMVSAGFEIQSLTQGRDFAPLPGVENPHIVRIIAK